MTLDPRTWDTDHWSLAVAILGLIIALPGTAGLFSFVLQWRKDSEERLKENPRLRGEWVARLRNNSKWALYRLALGRALDRLDGWFGAPGSARAWGVCVLVAVAYSWVTFFVGWGVFGASGGIGGVEILPKAEGFGLIQGLVLIWALIVPPLMFFLAQWMSRCLQIRERHGQARLLRRWPWPRSWGRRVFYGLWRLVMAGLMFAGLIWIGTYGGSIGKGLFFSLFLELIHC